MARVFADIQAKRNPTWDVRVVDSDHLDLIPQGATVVWPLGRRQWVATSRDDHIGLERAAVTDSDRRLLDRLGGLVDAMSEHLQAADLAGPSRDGQRHLLAVDVDVARFNLGLALWQAGDDEALGEVLDRRVKLKP